MLKIKIFYATLKQANNNYYQKLMLLMFQAVERSLNIYLNAFPENKEEYVTKANIVNEPSSPYGQEYVSLLARQGNFFVYKEGRNRFTTKMPLKIT